MAKQSGPSFDDFQQHVLKEAPKPVYLLMGKETFYIQRAAELLIQRHVPEEDRDFGLRTFYGADTDAAEVVIAARSFPFGVERQVVIVREAQKLAKIALLETYLAQPQPATILVLCYMNGTLDRRLRLAASIGKVGYIFQSDPPYPERLPAFVETYCREKKLAVHPAAAQMLADFIGADLARMASEIDKLAIALPEGQTCITPELVEQNTGISKDFTPYELCDALGRRDILRAGRIVKYFNANPKTYPLQLVLPALFNYFADLMQIAYAPDRSPAALASALGKNPWVLQNKILPLASNYTPRKLMNILSAIRRTDARSKGVDNPSTTPADLLRELVFYILH